MGKAVHHITIIYYLSLLLFIGACANKQDFTLSGKFKGLKQGEFLCFSTSPEWGSLDTIHVQDGKFSISHPLSDTIVLVLQYPNFMQTQVIAIPGCEVTISGNANNMLAIDVGNDEFNEALTDFRKSLDDNAPLRGASGGSAQATAKAETFIMEHPESWASIALFEKYFLQVQQPDYQKIATLLQTMTKARPNRKILRQYQTQLAQLLPCRPGKKLPAFQATTLKGETISNATFKGRPLLIQFWSSITPEYTQPLVNSRPIMQRLQPRIAQLNICLDVDTAACRRRLRNDTIAGYNVCDRQAFASPLVQTFGLRVMPANILVDSLGIIRERDIPQQDLEKTLRKYL